MRIGASLVLIAIGAILKWGVTARADGVNIGVVGVILMIVGAAGLLITVAIMSTRRRTDVTYRRDGATYVEPAPLDAP